MVTLSSLSQTLKSGIDASLGKSAAPLLKPRPRHVAIIMDGNGRWAAKRSLPRLEGHRRGMEALRRTVHAASQGGIEYLTLYSFSAENWRRPATEIADLFGLLKFFIRQDLAQLHAQNVQVRIIGERAGLAPDIDALLTEAETLTQANTGLCLVIAFNYGARQEIAGAVKQLCRDARDGRLDPESIDEATIARCLHTVDVPDPDLVIRTSGEMRLSNFLLWQAAYAEFVFTSTLWPDFDAASLEAAIADYCGRDRRYGALSSTGP